MSSWSRRTLLAAAALLLAPLAVPAADPAKPAVRDIDVVICLDVSGSMEGLFNSVKVKLWDIVNDIARAQPTPNLRVALYSYGHTTYDPHAGWVRKEIDLTTDLDDVYRKLNALTINGGEEYVARVTRDALMQQNWSPDPNALKVIFVAGNEPVDQDKQVHLPDVAQLAKTKGVFINTIYCNRGRRGAVHPEFQGWKDYAESTGGRYACVDQDRGTVVIAAPQDKELAELNGKLNHTYVAYGAMRGLKAANQQAQDANAAAAGAPALAARAATKAGGLYRNSDWDLVDRLKADPKFDVKAVPEAELSDELKKLKPEEREAHVKKQLAERETIQKQITELNEKRQGYIAEQMKKAPTEGEKAFDAALRGAIREQAAGKGIKIPQP
jgi:hypothetical protein